MKKRSRLSVVLIAAIIIMILTSGCQSQPPSGKKPSQSTEESVTDASIVENPTKPSEIIQPSEPEEKQIQAPSIPKNDYPKVDGSTATLPLSIALYQLVTGSDQQEAEGEITHTKTTNAYRRLIYGYDTNLVLAYEPAPSIYELMEKEKVNLIIKPIGKDALVFMANEGNPVTSLTGQELVDIYTGKIQNWTEVGGTEKEIMAFQRPSGSGSQTLMEKLVMKDIPMNPDVPQTLIISDMGELIEAVASYNNEENALGYSVYFYARNMFTRPGLRFMEVEGVMPSNETIKSGAYPYVNEFYAAIREDEPKDSNAYKLFEWLTTPDGQALVEGLGYVGMGEVQQPARLQRKDEAVKGDAQIQFAEDERLLLDCQYAYGTEGVAVLNEAMEVERIIPNVRLGSNMKVVRLSEPIILGNKARSYGIYNIEKDSWMVEPEYWDLTETGQGTYIGYKIETDDEVLATELTWVDGTFESQKKLRGQIGDKVWQVSEMEKKAVIKNMEGTIVKEVNFQEYGDYAYGYIQEPFFIAQYQDESFVLFDCDGQVIFQKELIDPQFIEEMRTLNSQKETNDQIMFSGASSDGTWIGCRYGSKQQPFIYDLQKKKVITSPGDQIELYTSLTENIYIVNKELYQSDGTKILSTDGTPYSHVVGMGYYAYENGTELIVERKEKGERYVLPVTGMDYMDALADGIFYVFAMNGTGRSIYQGETCIAKGDWSVWWLANDKYIVITDYQSKNILFDKQGNIRYQSNIPESIQYASEELIATVRGNYLYVMDYEGRCALKLLMGYMGDD